MVYATLNFEQQLWLQGKKLVAGVDEVGRGCFAGPVVTAAVIFPPDTKIPVGIADSKLLKPQVREELAQQIKESALAYFISEVSVEVINQLGIGKATQQSFLESVLGLDPKADFVLIDAFLINGFDPSSQRAIAGGDRLSASIAAASIIAKVYRDELMRKLDSLYPDFQFAKHKGYGTKLHQEAIKKYGLTDLHRKSFNLSKFL